MSSRSSTTSSRTWISFGTGITRSTRTSTLSSNSRTALKFTPCAALPQGRDGAGRSHDSKRRRKPRQQSRTTGEGRMKKIVAVIGGNGQLGSDVVEAFTGSGEVYALSHQD